LEAKRDDGNRYEKRQKGRSVEADIKQVCGLRKFLLFDLVFGDYAA
jgi:hypothetical protein